MKQRLSFLLSWTNLTRWVILISVAFTIIQQGKWKRDLGYAFNDAKAYYTYLPAVFIHHSLNFEVANSRASYSRTPEGKSYIKYTMGTPLCYLPGFLVAHGTASLFGLNNNGYSFVYQLAFILTALVVMFLSLRLATKILSQHYDDKTVALSLFIVFLGTNYFHYATSYLSYSHIYSFYFILLFLYRSALFLQAAHVKNALWLGLSFGMMSLIRPVDGIFLLFPLLFKVNSFTAFGARISYFLKNIQSVLLAAAAAILVWAPQLLYNYSIFDKLTINSYKGESFYFLDPEIYNILFSFNNGWLVYTPLMVLGLLGCIYFLRKRELSYLVLTLIYIYILSSWWCWWYVGYGNRAFVNLLAFLIFPLAELLQGLQKSRVVFGGVFVVILAGVGLNQFQTYQFENDAIRFEAMSKASYQNTFGYARPNFEFYDQLEKLDTEYAKNGINALHKRVYDTLKVHEAFDNLPFKMEKADMYIGSYKFKADGANTFVITANTSSSVKELGLPLQTIAKEGCAGDYYAHTRRKKLNDTLVQFRMYYRFKEEILGCQDSLYFYVYNPKHEEGRVYDVRITNMISKDSLFVME